MRARRWLVTQRSIIAGFGMVCALGFACGEDWLDWIGALLDIGTFGATIKYLPRYL